MDNIDLAKSIEQEKLAKYKKEMEDVRKLFIEATGAFFVIWYNSTAMHYVVSGSQNSISLGKDQLTQLKAKLKDLTDNAERCADDFLSADSLWCHSSSKGEDNYVSAYSQYGSKYP